MPDKQQMKPASCSFVVLKGARSCDLLRSMHHSGPCLACCAGG